MPNRRSNAPSRSATRIACVAASVLLANAAHASDDAWQRPGPPPAPSIDAPRNMDRGVDRVLLDGQLRARRVWLLSIEGGVVTYRDADGLVHAEPVSNLLALTTPLDTLTSDAMRPPVPRIELVDGLRLPGLSGSNAIDDAAGESLAWNTPSLGPIVLALSDVRRVILQPSVDADGTPRQNDAPPTSDRVSLTNGDVIEGFVARIGREVEIEDASGALRTIPTDRTSEIALANPGRSATGMVVWLAGGSVVQVERIGQDAAGDGRLVLPGAEASSESPTESIASEISVPLPDLYAVVFDAARLVPLSTIRARAARAESGRRWTPSLRVSDAERAPLRLGDIEIPGPMSVEWPVPAGATRFATTVTLPRAMRVWGDCVVAFELIDDSGGVLALDSRRVLGEQPSQRVSVALPPGGRVLRVSVLAGERGPIQDCPVLEGPVFLMGPGAAQ
ncbi:MAG: hypothetical protein RBS39_13525 [Phycisphaerales bacterium]|jgi:hypothetical protein|nr:hypothetical protein [Phycisphaerales bacterium]